jgi:dTDP-4-dehydrorhamnose reductase
MKPTILLTGKSGQVGRELNRLLPYLGEIVACDRGQLDLSRPADVREAIRTVRPNIIVNAAAYTAVDRAESDEPMARAVNADAPGAMAEEAKRIGAVLVHYSTDYVFDGTKRTPYVEEDLPNPQNAYGRTKLAGEQAIQQSGAAHLIFRTAWVYAREGKNFLLTILRLATEREELRIVRDQIGTPTSSQEIAAATSRVLTQLLARGAVQESFSTVSGIYHVTASGETSWHAFAKGILEESTLSDRSMPWLIAAIGQRPLIARRVIGIGTDEYPTRARRPAYSVLSNGRLARVFGVLLPDWRTALHSTFLSYATGTPPSC